MYDFAEIRSATDEFWNLLRQNLMARGVEDVPLHLERPRDLPAFWSSPSLLIGQTCGYPLMIGLCGSARYVASPRYKTPYSLGVQHRSVIIARRNSPIQTLADCYQRICAINMLDSNTGMNLLRLEVAKLNPKTPFFSHVYETLAHRKSMLAVAKGEADIAAIDCVTFAHIEKIDPGLVADLRIIGTTEETPTLPFITSADTDDETLALLRQSLIAVSSDPRHQALMQSLLISGIEVLSADAYDRVREIEKQAIGLHYPELR